MCVVCFTVLITYQALTHKYRSNKKTRHTSTYVVAGDLGDGVADGADREGAVLSFCFVFWIWRGVECILCGMDGPGQ